MKHFLNILLLLFLAQTCFAQNETIDSLKQKLKKKDLPATVKVDLYLLLSSEFLSVSIDSSIVYTKKAAKLSAQNRQYRAAKIYSNKGLFQHYAADRDSAHYYFDKALEKLDQKEDSIVRSEVYSNYSISLDKDFEKAITYNNKAINLVKENDSVVCKIYYNQGVLYFQNNFEGPAKKYISLGYESSVKGGNTRLEGISARALAYIYRQEQKVDSATIYLEKALALCERTKSPEICYGIHVELGEFYDGLKQHKKAKKAFLEANKYALARKKRFDILSSFIMLGRHESQQGNYAEASQYFEEFERIFKQEEPVFYVGVNAYESWSELETKKGNYNRSNKLLKTAMRFKDSLYSNQNKASLATADAKYEAEKKDKEIATKNLQLQAQENNLLKKENQFNMALGAGVILVLLSLGLWLFFRQNQKLKNNEITALQTKQELLKLEALIDGEEKERNRLAQDLHDGINGDLSVIKYKISSIAPTSLSVKEKVSYTDAITMLDNAVEEIRRISHNLAPPSLQNFDLVEAIAQFCLKQNTSSPVNISFQYFGNKIVLKKENETAIYRIIQELVNNSIKHAQATEALVQINNHGDRLSIVVEDNGKGFDPERPSKGIGLQNIQSRVDFLKADLDLSSGPNGTTFSIEINLTKIKNT
ncbi:tetratricopeptide repeat-containing sensor histidine kinase [Spongiimicrobium salis]|uniref:tetratricopeptide repeat-containing sensor histidine kinase n=1 Tax=Spongiimicrobium salis TaxID=1667022 RepID=UPI00374CE4F5